MAATGPVPEYTSLGSSTQNSLPSGSASTAQGTSPWPTSPGRAPRSVSRLTSSAWCCRELVARSRCTRSLTALCSGTGTKTSGTALGPGYPNPAGATTASSSSWTTSQTSAAAQNRDSWPTSLASKARWTRRVGITYLRDGGQTAILTVAGTQGHGSRRGHRHGGGGRGCLVVVLLAAKEGDRGGGDRHRDRRGEHDHQAVVERAGDQVREKLLAGQHLDVAVGQLVQDARAEQVMDRVVAAERREQRADRRQVRGVRGDRGGHALAAQPGGQRPGQIRGQARHHQREEDANGQRGSGVLERGPHARGHPPVAGRHAAHDRRGVRRRE